VVRTPVGIVTDLASRWWARTGASAVKSPALFVMTTMIPVAVAEELS